MPSPDDPFLRPDSVRYEDIVADGFVELLRTRGVDGLTMRALAAWMRVTPSAVTHRARWPATIELFVAGMTRRWVQWSLAGLCGAPQVPALPATAAERHGVRCWYVAHELALTEAAAGRPAALAAWLDAMRIEEESLLDWWLADGRPGATLDAFRLVLSGVRLALAMDASLPVRHGREVVARALRPDGTATSSPLGVATGLNAD